MRTASGYQPPAVPYHTPIRGSLSTPRTIPFQGNAQYITNRDWLLREHPEEETLIGDFSKTVTFQEVADRMRAGEEFYEICDCGESVQREYCFGRMAKLFGTNYEYWYRTWLDRKPPTSLKPRAPRRTLGKFVLVTRITK